MIIARLVCQGDFWISFDAKGHAEYAMEGHDVVCAAFSCLVRTVSRYCASRGWLYEHQVYDDGFFFKLDVCSRGSEISVIMQLFVLGLRDLQSEYPQSLRLEIEERE